MKSLSLKIALALTLATPIFLQAAQECVTVRPGKQGLIAFGQVSLGVTKSVTVTVSNKCQNPTSDIAINVAGFGFGSALNGKIVVIPARTRTKFTVQFIPTEAKAYTGFLTVYHTKDLGSNLSGTGVSTVVTQPILVEPIPGEPVILDSVILEEEIPADELILNEVPIEDLISEQGPTGLECCKKIRNQMLVRKASGVSFDVTGRRK